MDKGIITISLPKSASKEEIKAIRDRYKDKYKVHIVISGGNDPEDIIKNFLKARLET